MIKHKLIDFHIHIFPDHTIDKIISYLENKGGIKAVIKTSSVNTENYFKKKNIISGVNMPIATTIEQVEKINNFIVKQKKIFSFGAIHPDTKDIKKTIDFLKRNNIKGVKLHPEYQNFFVDSKKYFDFYKALIDADLYIMFHAGRDIAFIDYHSSPKQFDNLKQHFPDLKIILAHFGGFKMWQDVEKYIIGKDFLIDTSFILNYYDNEKAKNMIISHDDKNILFGSDLPWQNPVEVYEKLLKFNLDNIIYENIFFKNAMSILK